ncbi:EamA family transporter [Tardiphaga sp.]|uniref:EamA family transporter n=1 Tax=Tardiphaga sp. TaxID=1926292 RepID=UPI00352A730E
MTLGPMGVCYLTWFATLRRLPPATAAMGTVIVPVMGVIGAAALLGEPLGLRELIAMTLTLGGVTLALRRPARRPERSGTGRDHKRGAART